MRSMFSMVMALGMAAVLAHTAAAWGPSAQRTIVNTAMQHYAKDQNIPLNLRAKDLQQGAAVTDEKLAELLPALAAGPVHAIEAEMALLRAVYGNNLDPYFAYRLGVLGKLVAQLTAPMRDADPAIRDSYYADVERGISGRITLKSTSRTTVDPAMYFSDRMAEARQQDTLIAEDYRSGVGFAGLAGRMLADDVGRSIRAVADVWHTILSGGAIQANVSTEQKRAYVLDAFNFYTQRRNPAEIDAISRRLEGITDQTPDMQVRIGDMLYAVELYDRAMQRYQTVLRLDPSRRDVVVKISDYYVRKGDEFLDAEQFEKAFESYTLALDANPLHPEAEGKRIEAERLRTERDARQAANRELVARAEQFQAMAEQEALKGRFAETIVLLREAENAYGDVTSEFAFEHMKATRGLQDIRQNVQRYKTRLVEDAQSFSGAGFALDAPDMAQDHTREVDDAALRALLRAGFQEEMRTLERDLQPVLERNSAPAVAQ